MLECSTADDQFAGSGVGFVLEIWEEGGERGGLGLDLCVSVSGAGDAGLLLLLSGEDRWVGVVELDFILALRAQGGGFVPVDYE